MDDRFEHTSESSSEHPGHLGLYSAIATALMFCVFGPAVFGISVVITEGAEELGALTFPLGGALVILAMLALSGAALVSLR